MYAISSILYLDLHDYSGGGRGVYKKILVVNKMPAKQEPLWSRVCTLKQNDLSAFKDITYRAQCNMLYGIRSEVGPLVEERELDEFMCFLIENGYIINTQITELINQNKNIRREPNQKTLICYITPPQVAS